MNKAPPQASPAFKRFLCCSCLISLVLVSLVNNFAMNITGIKLNPPKKLLAALKLNGPTKSIPAF